MVARLARRCGVLRDVSRRLLRGVVHGRARKLIRQTRTDFGYPLPQEESEMRDLFDFLLAPARRTPWHVATLVGVFLGLTLIVGDVVSMSGLVPHGLVGTALVACFVAGLLGVSRGRDFDQGISAVFAAILIANLIDLMAGLGVVGAASLAGTNSASLVREATDLPLLGMMLLGLPVGTVGAGVGAWLSYRRSVA